MERTQESFVPISFKTLWRAGTKPYPNIPSPIPMGEGEGNFILLRERKLMIVALLEDTNHGIGGLSPTIQI